MYSSPVTQSGRGRSPASSTCQVWLVSGTPYGMLRQDRVDPPIGWTIDQIAASVAPPRLTTASPGTRSRIWSGRVTGIQSPLSRASRSDGIRTIGAAAR